ncbi:MAG: hypothetical protein ABI723_24745 [Bacteroidia bacterium]
MTYNKLISKILLFALFASSCKQPNADKEHAAAIVTTKKNKIDSLQQKLKENIHFISDSLLKGKEFLLLNYLDKYQADTCGIITYENSELISGFEGLKNIGDLNGDNINDTVFLVPPFNYCDEGYSYSFFDTSLPRLFSDSYCCHPDNLFSISDIDEDGTSEICIFYSSCVSRFKSLIAYTLKGGQWKQIGRCTFDINILKPLKEKRVRKISKGKFEMLEIVINNFEKKPLGDREWKQFSF